MAEKRSDEAAVARQWLRQRGTRRSLLLGAGATAVSLALAACGSSSSSTSTTSSNASTATGGSGAGATATKGSPTSGAMSSPATTGSAQALGAAPTITATDGSFKRVKDAGKITFGSSNDQPYAFLDTKTNQVTGIDADMLTYLLSALGIGNREMVQVEFSGLIPGLQAKRMDIISDAMYITDKRKQQINFTDPWYQYGETLVVAKGNPKNVRVWADLKGTNAASYLGTVYQDWLDAEKTNGVNVSSYQDVPTGLQDLANGRIDVFVVDAPVAAWDLKQFPDLGQKLEIVSGYQPKEIGRIGAGVRKEDAALAEAFNWALQKMKQENKDLEILQKWGLTEQNRVVS